LGTLFSDPVMIARLQSVFTSDFATSGNSIAAQADASASTIPCPAVP
jgi:hypothetical protein